MFRRPSDCRRFLDAVQRHLDGMTPIESSELAHVDVCQHCCKVWRFAQILEGFRPKTTQPLLPEDFASRVVSRAITSSKSDERLLTFGVAFQIVVMLLVFAGALRVLRWSVDWRPNASPAISPMEGYEPFDPARSTWTEPGQSVLSTLRRGIEDVLSPSRYLDIGSTRDTASSATFENLDRAVIWKSLSKLRAGAEAGFEPVGRSTRRAMTIFTREFLPDSSRKPDS